LLYLNPQAQVYSFKDTTPRESILFIDFYLKAEKIFFCDEGHENPCPRRVNHFYEPLVKWAPVLVVSGFLLPAKRPTSLRKSGLAHRNQGKVPGSKMLAQKQMLITHIAGA
jgi:hypothetical protein